MKALKQLAVPTSIIAFLIAVRWLAAALPPGLRPGDEGRQVLSYAWQIALGLAVALLVDRLLRLAVWDGLFLRLRGIRVPRLIQQLATAFLFLLAISFIVHQVFDQPVTAIWTTTGGLGLVVGFAIRDMILDVVAGLAINLERPFVIGDWICVLGREFKDHEITDGIGCVVEISWRTTRIRTIENNTLVIPNSRLSAATVVNFMTPGVDSRFEMHLWLDPSVPSARALRVLGAAIRSLVGPRGLIPERRSKVTVDGIDELGVRYRIKYWLRPAELSPTAARHQLSSALLAHLEQAGIPLAYPKRDVFHHPMPARHFNALSIDGRVELLSRIVLFSTLEPEDLRSLASAMSQRSYRAGEDLIRQGDPGETMFILVEGLVHVLIDLEGGGEPTRVAQMEPGAFFGEMSLLTGDRRSATIRAATDAVAFEITRDHVDQIMVRRPNVAELLSRAVAEHRMADAARAEMTADEKEAETESATRQILNKMRSFFSGVL